MVRMRIVFSSNVSWSVFNFRMDLLKTIRDNGYEVCVIASKDEYSQRLINEGFEFRELDVNNNSTNPLKDLLLIFNYYQIYKELKPDIILHNAIKPNIYGTIAAGLLKIPTINNISGLGTLFIKKSFSTRIAKFLYWVSQKYAKVVFFQNPHDLSLFVEKGLVSKDKAELIPGSGVDTNRFSPQNFPENSSNRFQFLFVGRLLIDKGIMEYIEAAKELKTKYDNIDFNVLGPFYENNSSTITREMLDIWTNNKVINYLGTTDEVEKEFAKVDCVVLPSYREGLSKVLIEASSMGLPIVTTNVPGCKDVVIHEQTGFLCNPKDAKDLAKQMERLFLLEKTERIVFGKNARERAISIFAIDIIIRRYIDTIQNVLEY